MPDPLLPQTFYGLVREYLPRIEHEVNRGVRLATVLASLPVKGKSLGTFRNALFHARRRALRSHLQTRGVAVPAEFGPVGNAQGLVNDRVAVPDSHPPTALRSMAIVHGGSQPAALRPIPAKRSVPLGSHRDFLELVRSTNDDEIF